jgi:hypothetical protein
MLSQANKKASRKDKSIVNNERAARDLCYGTFPDREVLLSHVIARDRTSPR